ncbi:GAF domain-containing protein [Erythrobacter sp. SCSIO 43205]|uniref:HWE histidine kinase domain-containing protein n=1 Tax=Erythrobacter sp. SCSIO 43205 TaxID=2779361 RepID=UPI001CA913B9|nr:HWE histidine kinase domain-containing protein [Erythrobacter sp. SCSIO 43205]UAB77925.1 GAF domain-containing protein [Erythrobacter sp. SCSIO 43205]
MKTVDEKALETCNKEPIHIPGSIQSFGCLIAFDRESLEIAAISANCERFIGKPPKSCLGKSLERLLDAKTLHTLSNKLAYSTIGTRREYVATIANRDTTAQAPSSFDLFVHAGPRFDYIELIASSSGSRALQSRIAAITSAMQQLQSLEDIFELATVNVHAIAEYDRTMFYRFLPDGSGEVVAECCAAHMEPFLGLRYPAWDIPKQARQLYAKTPIRTICDVRADPVALICAPEFSHEDFDLSIATLRGTSPVHLEYLANMGIAASMTIPIVVDGKLWGLITCHNETARDAAMDLLDAGEVIGHLVSFSIAKLLRQKIVDHQSAVSEIRDSFISLQTKLKSTEHFAAGVEEASKQVLSFDGLCVVKGAGWHNRGTAPSRLTRSGKETFTIASEIADITGSNSALHQLGKDDAAPLAGFIDVPLVKDPDTRIIFFRKAVSTQVTWAGHPDKDIEEVNNRFRLSPRKSFARYIEDNGDKCDEWSNEDIQFLLHLQRECAASQSAAGRILQQKDNLRILADELNHRVKNILALVKSLSSHAREAAATPEDYAQSLERRLFSLAASHDLLTQSQLEGISLRDLFTAELEPFLSPDQIAKSLSGPDVVLAADAVPMATLLIHELASNAAKHGALSEPDGRVAINWLIAGQSFILQWKEHGGPPVAAPNRHGFGMELLREAIPYEFNGTADLTFAETGFEAIYNLAAHPFLKVNGSNSVRAEFTSEKRGAYATPALGRALIVEDSYLLATEHSKLLKRLGFQETDLASSVGAAISMIEQAEPEFALLDINLREEMSFAIADALTDRGVPFAFVTGYGSAANIPSKFAETPFLKKPLTSRALEELLGQS